MELVLEAKNIDKEFPLAGGNSDAESVGSESGDSQQEGEISQELVNMAKTAY